MAGQAHLLRLLGARFGFRVAGEPGDRRDHASAGDAGRAGAAQGVGQERARPRDLRVHERARPRVRVGRRRRGRSAPAGADAADPGRRRHQDPRGGAGGPGACPGGRAPGKLPAGVRKFNPHHDERGLFATADNAAGPVGSPARKPRPTGVQVASNDAMMSDAGPSVVAQAEGEEDEEPRPDENSENGIIEYFDPDTGRIVPYPARAIPPQGWVDMRSLPDPSKPTK